MRPFFVQCAPVRLPSAVVFKPNLGSMRGPDKPEISGFFRVFVLPKDSKHLGW